MTARHLRPLLERRHASWQAEVAAVLGPAQRSDAGPWTRWNALRYLEGAFPARVTAERRLVQSVASRLSEAERGHLWALGELLDVFPAYLGHLIGLCHRAGEFGEVTARILDALGRWCRTVEEALGPLPVSALPERTRESLEMDVPGSPTPEEGAGAVALKE